MNQSNPILVFCFIFLISCSNGKNQNSNPEINIKTDTIQVATRSIIDTALVPFEDSTKKLRITSNTSIDSSEDVYNTSIVLLSNNTVIYSDSIYSMLLDMYLKDFDNDGHKDLLIFHSSGGRANPTFYLYLLKPKGNMITKVEGFELLPNPELDGNIVTSTALAGSSYIYKFYHISNDRVLILDSFVTSAGDSLEYEKRIKLLKSVKVR